MSAEQIDFIRLPFRQIVSVLAGYDIKDQTRELAEYQVDGLMEAGDLRASLDLPFEISLTEHQGSVIITPLVFREANSPGRWQAHDERAFHSRLNAHTHNLRANGKIIDILSLPDFPHILETDGRTPVILVHGNGISHFQKPITNLDGIPLNPDLQPANSNQFFEVLRRYQEENDFSILALIWGFGRMGIDQQTQLAQGFIQRTGMLVRAANWGDPGINGLIAKLNLHNS